jgi:hypothetical protein
MVEIGNMAWPRRRHVAPSKPGRGLCQDISLLAKLAVLLAKASKLVALFARQTVAATAVIAISLLDPAMDRRRARLKLPGQVFYAAPGLRQRNNLFPEFRRVRVPRSRHQDTIL